MRLWSLHPEYLDTKGLLAVWREGLLAKKVLEGNTRGYKNHPQLIRFRESEDPLQFINAYLYEIVKESLRRSYRFDSSKIEAVELSEKIPVSFGQLEYEKSHLLKKLEIRDGNRYLVLKETSNIKWHSLFYPVEGGISDWEIV